MSVTTHRFCVAEARRVKHPEFPTIEKHSFLVRAAEMPRGINWDANARDPVNLKTRVYRQVRESLLGLDAVPGTFDLMNKGITILADKVKRVDDSTYDITISDGQGIVDGAHTYTIICECRDNPELPDCQYVEVQVRTGIEDALVADIARGLNTAMQVKEHSLDELARKYDWIKEEIAGTPYEKMISWKESDNGEYDVRDLIAIMELFNVVDFPNDSGVHPVSAYEKWSIPEKKFSQDANKYLAFRPILKDMLHLVEVISRDFRRVYDGAGLGTAAKLDIVEEKRNKADKNAVFAFPFTGLPGEKYRLTKGALYPIAAAFRNMVEIDQQTGSAKWKGNFSEVHALWNEVAEQICRETKSDIREYGHKPNEIGKSRNHWNNMHKTVELHILRRQLADRSHAA